MAEISRVWQELQEIRASELRERAAVVRASGVHERAGVIVAQALVERDDHHPERLNILKMYAQMKKVSEPEMQEAVRHLLEKVV